MVGTSGATLRSQGDQGADYSEKVGLSCSLATEEIIRILYHSCALFNGTTKLPVSGNVQTFNQMTPYLHDPWPFFTDETQVDGIAPPATSSPPPPG
jgi:hypothetical protein